MATEELLDQDQVPNLSPINPQRHKIQEPWTPGPKESSPIPWDPPDYFNVGTPNSSDISSFIQFANDDQLQRYCKHLFDVIDEERRGFVTCEDFQKHFHESFDLAENVMSQLDEDNDGKLSFDEFFLGFRSFAIKLQEDGEGPVDVTLTYPEEESVFESHSNEGDERWSRAASRMSLPENLAQSAQLKSFWNKVFDLDPLLIPSLESTLFDIGKQIKESKDSLQLLERHLKKRDSQHVAQVASLEEELEGHLNDIILEYSARGDSLEQTLKGKLSLAVNEKEAEILDLLKQVERLKQELSEKDSREYKLAQRLHRFDACSYRNLVSNPDDKQTVQVRKRFASADDVLFTRASEDDVSSPVDGTSPVCGEQITSSQSGSSVSSGSRGSHVHQTTKSTDGDIVHERVSDIMNLATVGNKVPDEPAHPRITLENGIGKECGHSGSPAEYNTVASGVQPTQQVPVQYKTPTRVYKIVVLGDSGVGKTFLINSLCSSQDVNQLQSTIGVDYLTTVVEYGGETVALQFWDTAGQERFAPVCALYLRRADGVVVTYDITSMSSFDNVKKWVEIAKAAQRDDLATFMIIGTKADLEDNRVVPTNMAQQRALYLWRSCSGYRHLCLIDTIGKGVCISATASPEVLKSLFCEVSSVSGKNLSHVLSSLSKVLLEVDNNELKRSKQQADSLLESKGSKCFC